MKTRKTTPSALSRVAEPYSREPDSAVDKEERIRLRAYELYIERGRLDGHDMDDWLQAEAEILGTKARKAVA